jgi:hypothetical protein
MTKYFVWIAGLRGPEAQLWDEKAKTAEGKPIKTLMGPIEVGNTVDLTVARLMHPYPFEAKT